MFSHEQRYLETNHTIGQSRGNKWGCHLDRSIDGVRFSFQQPPGQDKRFSWGQQL